jgi:uncharacterized membrane protein YhhN
MKYLSAIYLLIGVLEVSAEALGNDTLRFITKPLLMPVLILFFFNAVKPSLNKTHKLLMVAFIFSWFGDVFLMFVRFNELFFLAGLASFLITHVLYVVCFAKVTLKDEKALLPSKFWILIPLLAYFGLLMRAFFPNVPADMQIPVAVYSATIALMVVFAINRYGRVNDKSFSLVLAGALMFMFSDSLIALNKFLFEGSLSFAGVGIMILYISGQYLIASGSAKQ